MNLTDIICAHAKALPHDLQRDALEFIEHLERRQALTQQVTKADDTEAFIARFAGCLGTDFPDDIDDADLGADTPRELLE